MKRALALISCILSCAVCFAQEKDLVINASSLFYDREKGIIEATGSVEARFRTTYITGNHLIYNSASREAYLDSGFGLEFDELLFTGQTLKYNLNKENGFATGVKMKFERANISGDNVQFDSGEVKLKNAVFEACGLTPPHYHLSAAEIDLFQKQGWLVAYWGIFWLGNFPSIPIPVYVYDFLAEQKGGKNVMPYPEFGSDIENGPFIQETLSWNLRPDLNGNYSFRYADKKGIGEGFKVNYRIDADRLSEADIFSSAAEAPRWGIRYSYRFGPEVKQGDIFSILPAAAYKKNEFNAGIVFREKINYERVSSLPDISFKLNDAQILNGKAEGGMSLGHIEEESTNLKLNRGNINGSVTYPLFDGTYARALLDAAFYDNLTHWIKLQGVLGAKKKINSVISSKLEYEHYFENRGASPFNYEKYRFFPQDKIGLDVLSQSGAGKLQVNLLYLFPEIAPQEIDYTAGLTLHCFGVDLTYRVMRQEFILGFSLN